MCSSYIFLRIFNSSFNLHNCTSNKKTLIQPSPVRILSLYFGIDRGDIDVRPPPLAVQLTTKPLYFEPHFSLHGSKSAAQIQATLLLISEGDCHGSKFSRQVTDLTLQALKIRF